MKALIRRVVGALMWSPGAGPSSAMSPDTLIPPKDASFAALEATLAFDRIEKLKMAQALGDATAPRDAGGPSPSADLFTSIPPFFADFGAPLPVMPSGKNWFWFALPGNILELADTGYVIRQHTDPTRPSYALHDPDGRLIGVGMELQPLKSIAERRAGDNKEIASFDPFPGGFDALDFIKRLGPSLPK